MKCNKCNLEMTIDHVDNGKYTYVCTNPQCTEHLKCVTAFGEPMEGQMKATEHEAREYVKTLGE